MAPAKDKLSVTKLLIRNRLKSLNELPYINVEITGGAKGTIRIRHKKIHALEFRFRWFTDHFIGCFIDKDDKESQAVISLYTPVQASYFVSAYILLNDLRAKQKVS